MRGFTIRVAVSAGVACLVLAAGASAATLDVTKTGDPVPGACTTNDCSLREAVLRANETAAADRIVLKGKTYRLTIPGDEDEAISGDLDVDPDFGKLTITGKGRGDTAIDGTETDRLFDVPEGAKLALSGLTLQNGNSAGAGGAIQSDGTVEIANAALRSNTASLGGGIYSANDARLTVTRTQFIRNDAGSGGGLINQNESQANLTRTLFSRNEVDSLGGGGIFNQNEAQLVLKKSTIDRNTAVNSLGGGGIFNQNDAQLRISDSTISRNSALTDQGGGFYIQNDSLVVLLNTTISGNRADEGGAIYGNNWPYIRINFSTIAKNRAVTAGGGIFDDTSPINLLRPPPFWLLRGSIVAANSAPGATDNCAVSDPVNFDSQGSNLDDENTCLFTRGSDQRNAKAALRKLAGNGGPTQTHALKPSSDAVGAAKKKGCPKRDQRGVKRPQGNRCDAGSYELKRR